jgi:uncharacterized protein YutE (UPF0331/DUF86 family)
VIVRREVVVERIDHLRSVARRLGDIRSSDRQEFLASYQLQWLAERGLQLAAQAVFDLGMHLLAGQFNVHPGDYEDVVRLLAAHRVISPDLESRMRGLGGFRNILVHGYLEIDPERVFTFLREESGVFVEFADAVERWMAANALE